MKKFIPLIATLLLIFTLYYFENVAFYSLYPTEKNITEKTFINHKEMRKLGKEPTIGKDYYHTKSKKVLIEGNFLYTTETLIDTLNDTYDSRDSNN